MRKSQERIVHPSKNLLKRKPAAATHFLAVVALHVQEVGGVHAAVDALLVTRDAALDRLALLRWLIHEVLQVLHRVGAEGALLLATSITEITATSWQPASQEQHCYKQLETTIFYHNIVHKDGYVNRDNECNTILRPTAH